MVMSDMHVLDKSLFDNGNAFSGYKLENNKVVEYSQELFDKAISQILDKSVKPDFILIPGDMSNDGEKVSHDHVVAGLKKLEEAGIKVYVTPGNNDINSSDAMSYLGSSQAKVASISADEFKSESYYGNFGYLDAIESDGLSYLAYPTDEYAVLSLDSKDGGLSEATLKWAEKMAEKALNAGRRVIGMTHYPIMEHFDGHAEMSPTYIANSGSGYPSLSNVQNRLVAAGIAVMFTGHYHMQSISKADTKSGALYDVMTGSLCAYPFRMRSATIDGKDISIDSESVTISTSGKTLAELGEERVESLTTNMIASMANMLYPKVEDMKLEFAGAWWYKVAPWPESAEVLRQGTANYMFDDCKKLVKAMAGGDGDQDSPEENYTACMESFEEYVFTDIIPKANIEKLIKLMKDGQEKFNELINSIHNQGVYTSMEDLTKSIFYNYVGDEKNVMADNTNTVTLNGEPKEVGIESIASDSADAPAYNLNGLRANANGEGFFIKDGKVMLRQK